MASARLTSYVLALEQSTEVICAYSSSPEIIPADPVGRWITIGAFVVPRSTSAFLQTLGYTASGVVTDVCLFGPELIATANCRLLAAPTDDPVFSQKFNLTAGVLYYIAGRAVGTETSAHFGTVLQVALSPRGTP